MANTESPEATYRHDLYRTYRFRLKWDGGKYCAGVSRVSALGRPTQVAPHSADGDLTTPRRMPGQSEYQAITLERGITHDLAFERWASVAGDYTDSTKDDQVDGTGGRAVSPLDLRKDIVLEVCNEAGQRVIAYNIYRCWPSEFTAIPELDANAKAVAIQTLVLQNEGWERDDSVTEPDEPPYVLPSG